MLRTLAGLFGTILVISGHAQADEVWTTPVGEIVYEADLETGEAVLSFPGESGERLLGIFPGLAGVSEGRGYFAGIWIDPDAATEGPCPGAMADPVNGGITYSWGRMDLIFTEPDFPAGFVVVKGACFDPPTDYLIAEPMVGE
ncbi:MAG: hypothetical protein C0456_02075 [Hyphomonas sp.]|uniref:hypothetical protein n=1 Tax=Hyphomonas sp. TaxID=87 RepID=UPI001D3F5D7F|nr:hypothetical protein [Hyphomonas sp.]MBA4225391.1 hypothetical protein [Hyphomonas sp.]